MKDLRGMLRLVCLICSPVSGRLRLRAPMSSPSGTSRYSRWEECHELSPWCRWRCSMRSTRSSHVTSRTFNFRQHPLARSPKLPQRPPHTASWCGCCPRQVAQLNATLALSLASLPDGAGKTSGVQYGDIVADAMYQSRLADNILVPGPIYISTGLPGAYQITSPGPAAAGQHERAELDSIRAHLGVAVPTRCPAGAHVEAIR